METKIYTNKIIIENLKNKESKKIAEYLDSKGVILLNCNEERFLSSFERIKFISTNNNIVTINDIFGNVMEVKIDKFVSPIDIYYNEINLDRIINERYDGINIAKFFKRIKINYEAYCKINSILLNNYKYYNLYKLYEAHTKDIIIELSEVKNNISNNEDSNSKILVFDTNTMEYKEYEELPDNFKNNKIKIVKSDIDILNAYTNSIFEGGKE